MEFMNRGTRPTQPATPAAASPTASVASHGNSRKRGIKDFTGLKVANLVLMASLAIILVSLVWLVARRSPHNENSYVDASKMQAVFINGGQQIYFGHIKEVNGTFIRLNDIFYLRVNQQVQPGGDKKTNDISLFKLGCELHGPVNEMLISRDQVTYWENIKSDGDVGKAVAEYRKQNPNGPDCAAQKKATQEQADKAKASSNATNTEE